MESSSSLSSSGNTPASVKAGQSSLRLDPKEEARKRLFQEFEVVFKRYVEALEFVNNRSAFSKYEQSRHDP